VRKCRFHPKSIVSAEISLSVSSSQACNGSIRPTGATENFTVPSKVDWAVTPKNIGELVQVVCSQFDGMVKCIEWGHEGSWTAFIASPAVIGKIFGHTNRLRSSYCLQVQPVTCWHPPVFLYPIGVDSINSSKMINKFPAVLNFFNRLFLKFNRFICN
jgi:hypothetical protein